MRYEVRHNNRVWHVFDTELYKAIDARETEAEAAAIVARLNRR